LQYGWLPLLSDVEGSMKAFHLLSSGPRSMTWKASRKGLLLITEGSGSPTNFLSPVENRTMKTIRYTATENISAARSLGLTDPLSIAWELIPYSFVVDWFIPIGSYLENLNMIPNLRGQFCSSRFDTAFIKKNTIINYSTYRNATWIESRRVTTRSCTQGLATKFPTFKPLPAVMSAKHVWNAIALASQRFK
jgi:hypothetical protein